MEQRRKPLHFIGSSHREVMKLVEDHDGDTYRAAYTVWFAEAVYVLHVFKKKGEERYRHPYA